MKYARIQAGVVAEVFNFPDTISVLVESALPAREDGEGTPVPEVPVVYETRTASLSDFLHPDLAAHCVPCGAEVTEGWLYDGRSFTAPAPFEAETPARRQFTFLEFMDLFTAEEQAAIVDSQATRVKLFLLMAAGASFINLDDPRTEPGVQMLVDAGLIPVERKTAVMAGQGPA